MILQIIGMIAMLAAGCYLTFAGVMGSYISYAFSGNRDSFWMLILAVAGIAIIVLAFYFSPFTLETKT